MYLSIILTFSIKSYNDELDEFFLDVENWFFISVKNFESLVELPFEFEIKKNNIKTHVQINIMTDIIGANMANFDLIFEFGGGSGSIIFILKLPDSTTFSEAMIKAFCAQCCRFRSKSACEINVCSYNGCLEVFLVSFTNVRFDYNFKQSTQSTLPICGVT